MTVSCIECGTALSERHFNSGGEFHCGTCGAKVAVEAFPALFRAPWAAGGGEALAADGEAGCFYHPRKKAATFCAACGRFLCTLCQTELGGTCLCPSCFEKGRLSEEIELLVTHRNLYDRVAIALAGLPLLFFPATVVTAPIALFIALRYWKKPGSILPRTKTRFVLAILLASAQIAGWLAMLFFKVT